MERILLAIDGMFPDKRGVEYALELCRRIRAELDVLHLLDPEKCPNRPKKIAQQTQNLTEYLQQAMSAAAFAESGEHETAREMMDAASAHFRQLLPNGDKKKVRYRAELNVRDPDRAISDYVKQNSSIVLAIYEVGASEAEESRQNMAIPENRPRQLQKKLPVPLVVRGRP